MVRAHGRRAGITSVEDFEADLVRAESLVDTTDSQVWETLREAGYEQGDVVITWSAHSSVERTFTDTSWSEQSITYRIPSVPLSHYPDDATVVIGWGAESISNDTEGETTTARLKLRTSGTSYPGTEASVTGGRNFDVTSPVAETSVRSTDSLQLEAKVSGGSGEIRGQDFFVGVQL